MANQLWSQDQFTKGELSPYMYARAGVLQYYNGLKTAQNVLCYPQGAAGKRFGTICNAETGVTSADGVLFEAFQYLNQCIYQLIYRPLAIEIYLEGVLVDTVTTVYDANDIANMDFTVLDGRFRVSFEHLYSPKDLTRAANSTTTTVASVTTGAGTSTFTSSGTPYIAGLIYPVTFTEAGGMMQTTPQIKPGVTYFLYAVSTSVAEIYSTAPEAKNRIVTSVNAGYTITSIGAGTTTITIYNNWSEVTVAWKNVPSFDFDGGYDAITFTPAATTGAAVTVTMSAVLSGTATMDTKYVGGVFTGNGGYGRITSVTSTTAFVIAIEKAFFDGSAISGKLSYLGEPAWGPIRGYPKKCSSFQNRALFANNASLPNGFWASAINDYADFDDMQTDDDDAISWYPTSNEINYIRFIVPYRSLTVHTNSGVYSSSISTTSAITPKNFSLMLQDSTPATNLQPRAIDNQIIVVSGNDVHNLLWDGYNNSYTSDIVSVMSEQVIREPVDETSYTDLSRAGSRYVFIVNENGTLAIYQTLVSQDVQGWTPNMTEQSYGDSKFRRAASSFDGRAWFLVEREIAAASAPVALSAYTPTPPAVGTAVFTATAHLLVVGVVTAVKFATTGTLLTSSPQIAVNTYYWAVAIDANTFNVYRTQADAEAGTNAIQANLVPINNTLEAWPLVTKFYLEELSFDSHLDCATYFNNVTPASTISGQSRFNAQQIKMIGDGFGFEAQGKDNNIIFSAHGEATTVSEGYIGFPINTIIEPMPLSMATGNNIKSTSLTEPKHVRYVRFMFNNTIGGTINGVPIALKSFAQAGIGQPPIPARGIMEMSIMKGWEDFNNPTYTIEHNEPFNIELLGVFYTVDV